MSCRVIEVVLVGVVSATSFYFAGSSYLKYKSVEGNTPKATEIKDFHKTIATQHTITGVMLATHVPPMPKNPLIRTYFIRFRLVCTIGFFGYTLYYVKSIILPAMFRYKEKF